MAILTKEITKELEYRLENYMCIDDIIADRKDPRRDITDSKAYPIDPNCGIRGINHITKPTEREAITAIDDPVITEWNKWKQCINRLRNWANRGDCGPVFDALYINKIPGRHLWQFLDIPRRTFYSRRQRILIQAYILAIDEGLLTVKD